MQKRYNQVVIQNTGSGKIDVQTLPDGGVIITGTGKSNAGKMLFLTENDGEQNELTITTAIPTATTKAEETFFVKITATEREEVAKWLEGKETAGNYGQYFLRVIKRALQQVDYDYWIASIEPTVVKGKLRFIEGRKVATQYMPEEWEQLCKEYAPERKSRMANLYELFIWYAWRIVKGYWSFEYVTNDSSSAGNYQDSPNLYAINDPKHYHHYIDKAGAKECGGYKDGQGNTCKIVTHKGKYKAVGGCYISSGKTNPVASTNLYYGLFHYRTYSHAVVVYTQSGT